jgi:hypothetical protein
MRSKVFATSVVLAICGALSVTGIASAGGRADTKVTIKEQNGDFWGYVSSPRPSRCADGRKIVLFKQKGRDQHPSNDEKVANDTASLNGDRYEWNTGNTGFTRGKFYARASATSDCKPDSSETVRV